MNDEYCDCPLDGSDEPNTAACSSGRGLECRTVRTKQIGWITPSKIHDGVIDCCDGSDESEKKMSMMKSALNNVLSIIPRC
jgi:hypothetical protein